ncbi:hypothetical protein [Actinacidiphila rubida]|nr:hypothetical protein [Actinacidiphila rubida]
MRGPVVVHQPPDPARQPRVQGREQLGGGYTDNVIVYASLVTGS